MLKRLIKNVRFGLATNSSSSHSLVYRTTPVSDQVLPDGESYSNEYGWDHFVLDSLGEKLMYVLTQRVNGSWWNEKVDEEEIDRIYEEYGPLFPEFNRSHFRQASLGYVDHQSIGEINLKDARDPLTEIHGGNDNGGPGCSDCASDDDWY